MKESKKAKVKALVLFSGGLDSILSVKLLEKQDIETAGIVFASYFFNAETAKQAAEKMGLPLETIDFSEEHLAIVKYPHYGYGKAINPCLDCHLLMLKKAKEYARKNKFDIIATGEVLGERPMSQKKRALEILEKKSGLEGNLLRPLSAKLLSPTNLEKRGLIKRDKLMDIHGKGRKRQLALAREMSIDFYPSPAGGCLLTDKQFGQRLREAFRRWPEASGSDIELIKLGRHFWADDNLLVVGRHQEENSRLKQVSQKGDLLIEPKDFAGPTIIIRAKEKVLEESLKKARELMVKYAPKLRDSQDNFGS